MACYSPVMPIQRCRMTRTKDGTGVWTGKIAGWYRLHHSSLSRSLTHAPSDGPSSLSSSSLSSFSLALSSVSSGAAAAVSSAPVPSAVAAAAAVAAPVAQSRRHRLSTTLIRPVLAMARLPCLPLTLRHRLPSTRSSIPQHVVPCGRTRTRSCRCRAGRMR